MTAGTSRQASETTIREQLLAGAEALRATAEGCTPSVAAAADLIAEALTADGKLLLCGNGGSAADCQHMAAEFVSCLTQDFRRPAIPAIALTTDTSYLTAYANDFGFEGVFARQVQALGRPGDVLLGITTSGGSRNVLLALEEARRLGLRTVALTGGPGGPCAEQADVAVRVPGGTTQHIQEAHLAVEHVICHLVERAVHTTQEKSP